MVMKVIAYLVLALVAISSCKKDDDCSHLRPEDVQYVRDNIDTLECDIIKNKGSLVTVVCNGDTMTIVNN